MNANGTWTAAEERLLDQIEAELIEKGTPAHKARMFAEQRLEKQLEQRQERLERQRDFSR